MRSLLMWTAAATLMVGCAKRDPTVKTGHFEEDDAEFVLLVVLDLSGSFQHLMAEDGVAYDFTLHAIDTYFRGNAGSNNQLILAQISGTGKSLLWQGTPRNLRQQFPTPKAFRDFLVSRADPAGSLVHDGVAHALRYVTGHRSVAGGKAKSVALILSDMHDTGPDTEQSEQKLMDAFVEYMKHGGGIGLYYVSQDRYFDWQDNFNRSGHSLSVVEMDINGRPRLPILEP